MHRIVTLAVALLLTSLTAHSQVNRREVEQKKRINMVDFDPEKPITDPNAPVGFIERYRGLKDSLAKAAGLHKDIERVINTGKHPVERKVFWKKVKYGFHLRELVKQLRVDIPVDNAPFVDSVVTSMRDLHRMLLKIEAPTEFDKEISGRTRAAISSIDIPYDLAIFRRNMLEDTSLHYSDFMIRKVREGMGDQMSILSRKYYPVYSYPSDHKDVLKFVSIRTGNDLFTPAGITSLLPSYKPYPDGRRIFQRNDDRDYTGSFLLEFGTDYLNLLRRSPINSYQVFLCGFDVYTPYFRDSLFSQPDSYNVKDRPHASFQYFGWSRHALSDVGNIRWSLTLKAGKIGGNAGAKFQTALHQDVSSSPRPRGWDAQIGNGGRIGVSLEWTTERQWQIARQKDKRTGKENPYGLGNMYLSTLGEVKFGTYMTTAGLGFMITNKKFAQTNDNFMGVYKWTNRHVTFLHHFMYQVSFTTHFVKHNTMLEGYGWLNTIEDPTDTLANNSIYKLDRSQIYPVYGVLKFVLSYSTKFFTVFYAWRTTGPETRFGKIGIYSPYPYDPKQELDITGRWHHFAEIGLAFRLVKG